MIHQSELVPVGSVGKTHGLAGEVNINFDLDMNLEDVNTVVKSLFQIAQGKSIVKVPTTAHVLYVVRW